MNAKWETIGLFYPYSKYKLCESKNVAYNRYVCNLLDEKKELIEVRLAFLS